MSLNNQPQSLFRAEKQHGAYRATAGVMPQPQPLMSSFSHSSGFGSNSGFGVVQKSNPFILDSSKTQTNLSGMRLDASFPLVNYMDINVKKSVPCVISPQDLKQLLHKNLQADENVDVWESPIANFLSGRYFGTLTDSEFQIQIYKLEGGSIAYLHKMRGDSWVNAEFEAKVYSLLKEKEIVDDSQCEMSVARRTRVRGLRKLVMTEPSIEELQDMVADVEEGYQEMCHSALGTILQYLESENAGKVAEILEKVDSFQKIFEKVLLDSLDAYRVSKILRIFQILKVNAGLVVGLDLTELVSKWSQTQHPWDCVEIHASSVVQREAQKLKL
jgi:uncharacterized protein YjhX (UPF0386 family)